MKKFTYMDYLKYQEYIGNIAYFKDVLKEDGETYQYNKKEVYHKHDKIFREILEDKKEVASFINKVLKLENKRTALKDKDIEKYNRKFITHNFKYAETDIIYRKRGEDIFFLIEHQSTIDYSMPYRILMYSLEIMKSMIDEKQLKKKAYKLPMVYPIVIYTGSKKWNVEKYIESKQQKIPGCEPVRFYEYNVVDINEYSEDELLKDGMFLSKLMLLEKATTSQKMIENLNKIVEENLSEKNKIFLERIIYHILSKDIGEKETKKLIDKLEIKKGGNTMVEELLRKGFKEEFERLRRIDKKIATEEGWKEGIEKGMREGMAQGKKKGIEQGKKEGIEQGKKEGIQIAQRRLEKQWIEKMIKSDVSEQKILEITEISQKELEEIKNETQEKTS